jgi:hypothetical protein
MDERVQNERAAADPRVVLMRTTASPSIPGSTAAGHAYRKDRRTIVALVSATLIALAVWGLVVALNLH